MPYAPGLITDPNRRSYGFINDGTSGTGSRYSNPAFSAGPIYDVLTRKYVQGSQGTPYTGALPGGGFANAGIFSATGPAAPVTPDILANRAEGKPDDFPRLYKTVQQPGVADYAAKKLAEITTKPGAAPSQFTMDGKDPAAPATPFDAYMAEFSKQAAATRAAAAATAATPIDTTKVEGELRGADRKYVTDSTTTLDTIRKNNETYEARQKESQAARANELRAYEAASNAVGDQAIGYAQKGANARQVGLGPNVSGGASGALSDRDAAIIAGIRVPLQRELSAKHDSLISEGMGLNREYLGNDRATAQFQQALNEAFRGNTVQTAQYLQNLMMQVRQLTQNESASSRAELMALLAREADNLGLKQRLDSGEISLAGMLAALEKSATDYTYRQPFDPNRIPATNSPGVAQPQSNYRPQGSGGGGGSMPVTAGGDRYVRPEGASPLHDGYNRTKQDMAQRWGPAQPAVPLFVPRGTNTYDYTGVPVSGGSGQVNGEWVGEGRPPAWQPGVPTNAGGVVPYDEFNRLRDRGYL